MIHGERLQAVVLSSERLARVELRQLERIGQAPEHAPEGAEQLAQPARAIDRERELAAAQRVRLQHSREPEVVVGVVSA